MESYIFTMWCHQIYQHSIILMKKIQGYLDCWRQIQIRPLQTELFLKGQSSSIRIQRAHHTPKRNVPNGPSRGQAQKFAWAGKYSTAGCIALASLGLQLYLNPRLERLSKIA